jgi:hypothetical protein
MLKWIADTLFLATITFVAYVICISVNRKPMAQMVVFLALMLFLRTSIEDLTPVIKRAQAKAQSIEDRVNSAQQSVDKFSQNIEGAGKIFQWGMPKGRSSK